MTATADLPNKDIQLFTEKLSFVAADKSIIIDSEDGNKLKLIAKTLMKGDAGDPGVGIDSIIKTGTVGLVDTYTITYSDLTTDTFDVTNGADGAGINWQGPWSAGTYNKNDGVTYNGSSYICISVSTTETPSISAVDWDVLAVKGTDGTGAGDMLASVYDPTSKAQDIFAYAQKSLTSVSKTANYTASVGELVSCDISAGSFTVTLPSAPADKSVIYVKLNTIGADKTLTVACGGTDKFNETTGNTAIYITQFGGFAQCQYDATAGLWYTFISAGTYNFATNFPGVDATTPITNDNISINYSTRVLTITPPLGYFNIFVDGGGVITRFRKVGAINFPAFTDTSGMWYFYFDSTGTAVTTQTAWTIADFPTVVPIYRLLWNKELFSFTVTAATAVKGDTYTNNSSTFTVKESITGGTTLICERTTGTNNPQASGNLTRATGAGTDPIVFSALSETVKAVAEYIEYHLNDIPSDVHTWFHLQGAQWAGGLNSVSAIGGTTPATNGSGTVVSLTTGNVLDDNLEYTVTNSTAGTAWTQDMGATTTPNNTNGGQFQIFTQNAAGLVYFIPASRFPFMFNATTNYAEYISAVGVPTTITSTNFFTVFLYATQNPRAGEAVKVVMYPGQYTNITNASAINWIDIQNTYPILNDGEIRPLYRLIYEHRTGWNAGNKFSALRAVQDLRKAPVTSTATATGSLPASSVIVTPAGNIASTNVQSALEELDTEKASLTGVETLTNKRITARIQSVSDAATITPDADANDCVDITAIAQAFTIANPSGTPTNFQKLMIRIKDNATARAITRGNGYVAGGVALPSTTVLSKITNIGFVYNTANSLNKRQCVAVSQEA